MSKGIESKAVFLVVAVIAGLVFLFIIFKFVPSLLQAIEIAFGIVKISNVENAILCSYHRCVDGCKSMSTQEISWSDNGKTVSCNDFCQLPDDAYTKDFWGNPDLKNLKVCNPNYPITINLKDSETIDKTHLTLGTSTASDVRCIMSSPTSLPNVWDVAKGILLLNWNLLVNSWTTSAGGSVGDNWLVVGNNLIKSYGDKEDCVAVGTSFVVTHDSLKQLTLNSLKINITTVSYTFGSINFLVTSLYKG